MYKLKFFISFLSLILLSPSFIFSQKPPTDIELQRIAHFIKVWGFLKYYHTEINSGSIDWDSVYISSLDKIKTNNNDYYNQFLNELINNLGSIDTCFSCEKVERYPDDWKRNFDLSWLNDTSMFSINISEKLHYIFENRFQGEGFYCSYAWGRNAKKGSIKFSHEKDYKDSLIIDDYRYRLLTLARFWNVIEYFYAYKYLLSIDWDSILNKYISILAAPTELEDYHLNVTKLIHEIEDTHAGTRHSAYLLKNKWNKKPPFDLYTINDKTIVNDIRYSELNKVNDINIGDEILEINGVPVNELRKEFYSLCKGSNEINTQRTVDAMLLLGNTDKFSLTIRRNENIFMTEARRFPYSAFWEYRLPEKPGLIQEKNYSIVNLGSVTQDNIDSIMSTAIKTNSIIFDLRNYPLITHFELAKYLTPVIKPFYRAYEPSLIDIGIFKPAVVEKITIENGKKFNGKIIVLVNEFTQSRGEFLSMYLQSLPNTIIIGSQTAGTDGNLTQIKLPGNIYGGFTNIIVEYPDGTQTQKNGILIDYFVKMTEDDIITNKDPYLEFAKEMANR